MKKEIIGYISGVINTYDNSMKRLIEQNVRISQGTKTLTTELNSLLDYIIDIPEENTDVAEVNARYVARIEELEKENIDLQDNYLNVYNNNRSFERQVEQKDMLIRDYKELTTEKQNQLNHVNKENEELEKDVAFINKRLRESLDKQNNGGIDWESSCRASWEGNKELEKNMQVLKEQFAEKHNLLNEYSEAKDSLEESLQNMMDNESRLNKRVEKAELVTKAYNIAIGRIFEENQQLHDELKKLTGPQWKED